MSTVRRKAENGQPQIPNASDYKFAIIVAEWNKDITSKLLDGALKVLKKAKCPKDNVIVRWVPGTLELPMAAQICSDNLEIDGIIAIGCVIRGGTPHFDYVCKGAFEGLMKVQLESGIPITFGLLTTENLQQAEDRAGGQLGNKGEEAAIAAIRMVDLQYELESTEYEEGEDFSIPNFKIDDEKLS